MEFLLEHLMSMAREGNAALAFLGNIGGSEILLILLLVLLVFGPKQLPEVAKTLGKTLKGVRKAADELRRESGLDEAVKETRRIGASVTRTVYSSLESDDPPAATAAAPAPALSVQPEVQPEVQPTVQPTAATEATPEIQSDTAPAATSPAALPAPQPAVRPAGSSPVPTVALTDGPTLPEDR